MVHLNSRPGAHMAAYANNHTIDRSGCSSAIPSDVLAVFDSFLPRPDNSAPRGLCCTSCYAYVMPPPPLRAPLTGSLSLFVCLLFVDALVCFRWLKDSCLRLLTFVASCERIIELEAVRDLVTGLETVIFWNSCCLLSALKWDIFDKPIVLCF